jgi:hypothetical protein
MELQMCAGYAAESTTLYMDCVTVVSGSPVNSVSRRGASASSHEGVLAWAGAYQMLTPIGGGIIYSLVSGDIVSGSVTFRLRHKTSHAATKTMYATADDPFLWWAKNIGPQVP